VEGGSGLNTVKTSIARPRRSRPNSMDVLAMVEHALLLGGTLICMEVFLSVHHRGGLGETAYLF